MKINDFTYQSDLNNDLTSQNSLLNQFEFTEALGFDQSYEGVPGSNILFGGMQIKKKKYVDDTAGAWMGIDSDGIAKWYLGDATDNVKWNGTALTIQGGTLTAGDFQTASSGERVVINSSAKTFSLINSTSNHVVAQFNYGTQITDPILIIEPQDNARIGLQIISAMNSNALNITYSGTGNSLHIDNNSNATGSYGIDIDRDGSNAGTLFGMVINADNAGAGTATGLDINTDGLGLRITNTPNGISIASSTGSYGLKIDNPTTYGIHLTQQTITTEGTCLFIDNNSNATGSYGIEIDRDGNSVSPLYGILIDCDNAGTGTAIGMDVEATDIAYKVGTTVVAIQSYNHTYFLEFTTDDTDPTGAGGAATGRIPIKDSEGNTHYIAYY